MATNARVSEEPDEPGTVAVPVESGVLLQAYPECLLVTDEGSVVFANRQSADLLGFEPAELTGRPIGTLLADGIVPPEGERVGGLETWCRRKDGTEVAVLAHIGAVTNASGTRLLIVTLRDISERKAGEEARFAAEAKYRDLVEKIPAVTYVDPVDENEASIYVSPQVTDLIGCSQEEWLTDMYCWRKHVHTEDIDRAWEEYVAACESGEFLSHEYRMIHEDGRVRWVSEQASIIKDEKGKPWLIQGVIFDITARKEAEAQVAFLAYHDKLTGLPNRAMFEEMLELALARAQRDNNAVAVLFLDLDNFKLVNDSLGHQAGDELLRQVADRLRDSTRETEVVARQGGDEFLILLADLKREAPELKLDGDAATLVAESVASRVREALLEPFDLGGAEFYASGSIGISVYPNDARDVESLLKNADAAMYQSKRTEPGGYVVFADRHTTDPMKKLSLATRLRHAVQQEDWLLLYQPIVNLDDGSLIGVEALLRWSEPNGGIIPPGEFIPLAEEMGLIEAIGNWVIEELAGQVSAWRDAGLELEASFNLSPRQLHQPALTETILGHLHQAGVNPHGVVVEITESTAMADPERTQKILTELHSWGLRLAIDDFGTGYSSLSRLKHLPVDILKIDRSFIRDVHRDPDASSMVQAMIQLARNLDMTPCAEGVETEGERAFLVKNGCPVGQGFHFSRPVPPLEISRIWEEGGRVTPAA